MSKQTSIRVLFLRTLSLLRRRVFLAVLTLIVLTPVVTAIYSITRGSLPVAEAAAPATLNFQARLLNSSGSLVPDGDYNIEFKLYNASTSGTSSQGSCTGDANCLWTETRTGGAKVEVKNGYLSAYLGDVTSLPTNIWDQQLWLTMNIGGTGSPSWDGEMTPRIRLTSVPYAFQAKNAETLTKLSGSGTGTVDFSNLTADRKFLFPDTSLATTASPGTICVYNGSVSNCPAATGSAYYIHNDDALQSTANFNIQGKNDTGTGTDGTVVGTFQGAAGGQTVDLVQYKSSGGTVLGAVTADGSLQVGSSLDLRSAGTLSIGTATATAITIGDAGVTTTNAGALTVTELGTFNGGLTVDSDLTVTGDGNVAFQRNTTDYTATGPQDNINFGTGALFRITSASALTINGIAGGTDGRIISLVNASANAVSIGNSASGTPANHVVTGTGGTLSVPAGSSVQLAYDSAANVWRVIGGVATSGGGANQQLSNLGSTDINAALNATANDLTLQTTTSGDIILNSAGTIKLQDNTDVTGTLAATVAVQAPLFDTATAVALGIGTGNATDITIGHNAGTLGIDATNFDLSTAGVITLAGGQTADITTQANQNLTVEANGSGTISLNDAVSVTNTLTLRDGTTDITTGTDENLTVVANGNGIIELNDTVTVAGNFTVTQAGNVAFQRNTTNYTATGPQDNINFGTGALFRITSASALTINGVAGGTDGRVITLINASANAISIGNSASGTPANHVVTGTGGTLSVPAGSSVQLAYDSASSVWRVIGGTAVAGGGANQQLSNLSGTVAVNSSLLVGTSGLDLGATGGNGWRTLYADTSVLTPLVGRASAGTLSIGTDTNSTALTISRTGILTTIAGTLQANEASEFRADLTVTNTGNVAFQRNTTSYTVTGTQEITLGSGVVHRVTSATSTPILTGLTGGTDGRIITLMNASANTLTIQNDSGGTAANRIITGSGLNSLIPAGGSVQLAYDSASSRWRIIGSSTGSIQLQATTPGTAQTGNFNVSGTGIAGTALYSPLFDTATAVALGIGTTNATNISIGHNGGTIAIDGTNFDLSTAGVLTLAGSQTSTGDINTAASGAGSSITIKVGNSTNSGVAGGTLTLQGGAATAGNANGGSVTITGGAGSGTGTQGLVNLSTTAFTSASVFTASSTPPTINNISVSDVNLYATIPVNATNATAIVSVPDPTISTIGRVLYVTARDSSTDFTLRLNAGSVTPIDIAMKKNSTATLIWNGDEWTAAGASSSTDLQSAYNNTLTSAGGAEILLNPVGGNADGFTIRNNGTTPIVGGLLEVQTSIGSNLLSVNNNAAEYAVNGGAESATLTGWGAAPAGGTATKYTTAGDNIATGQASIFANTTGTANTGVKNTLSGSLTQNLKYKVSFSTRNATATPTFTTLQAIYSADGTASTATCSTNNGATTSFTSYYNVWTRVDCTFTATSVGASNAIIIRHSDSTEHDFYIDNLSVTVGADVNHAADGDADSGANIGGGSNNWGVISSSTVTQVSTPLYNTNGAVSVVTGASAGKGVYNKLANNITPTASNSTLVYRVSFYARGDGTNTANLDVKYSADGSNNADCQDFNTQTVAANTYTLVSCYFRTNTTVPTSSAQLKITQTGGSATTFYVDGLAVNLNTNTSSNVQIGGANKGGPTTLLTLDRASSPPIAANNDAYLGSMYYDTTTGRIQCYEADGWGACGSSPDIFVTLTPEYTGAVLNGNGIGVMNADFCGNGAGLSVNTSLCTTSGTSRQYYRWTSPQATEQVYSIYVSYKLPTTFKSFTSDDTINLTARTSNTTTGHVTYEVFKSTGAALTACGSATDVTNTSDGPDYWSTKPINGNESTSCSFAPGDNVVFKINMKSYSNANVYVENLTFTYNNN